MNKIYETKHIVNGIYYIIITSITQVVLNHSYILWFDIIDKHVIEK